MRELLLDANLLVRFLANDDAAQSPIALQIFEQAERGNLTLFIDAVAIAECIYVLTGVRFKRKRAEVAQALRDALGSSGIVVRDEPIVLDALARFSAKSIDFQDAWLAANAAGQSRDVVSFDRDLDRFSDVRRIDPGSL
jgi:predicted nucleic-acid-binding protein